MPTRAIRQDVAPPVDHNGGASPGGGFAGVRLGIRDSGFAAPHRRDIQRSPCNSLCRRGGTHRATLPVKASEQNITPSNNRWPQNQTKPPRQTVFHLHLAQPSRRNPRGPDANKSHPARRNPTKRPLERCPWTAPP